MSECTHRKVTAWSAEHGEPVDFWSCADCGRRFEPLGDVRASQTGDYPPTSDDHFVGATETIGSDELEALRRDAERLDSGCIMTHERDEFGMEYKCERRGVDLRAAIDEAMAKQEDV